MVVLVFGDIAFLRIMRAIDITGAHSRYRWAGGASLSTSSISAGLLGAAAAIPLVLLKAATWKAGRFIPALADVQKDMLESWGAIMYNLSAAQVAVVILAETVPNLVMLLPAAQGALTVSFNVYIGTLLSMLAFGIGCSISL